MIFGNKSASPELPTMNLKSDMCRVCMMTSEYLKDVVSFELTPDIISMLSSFANIDVSTDECLPSLICNKCYTSLMDSFNFKNLCIQSNNTYKDYISKLQNERVDTPQGNKEIPPPKSASPAPLAENIKIELKRKDSESENIFENISHNMEFIAVKNIAEMIDEPAPELLNALGLIKVSDVDNITRGSNSDESLNSSSSINSNNKDCKLNNNNKKKSYKCKVCRDIMYDYGVYRRHLASHGERPYTCKICGEHFSKARALKEHSSNIHSGDRPYSCTQCSSKFVRLSDLTTHLRKHAGNAQPHTCSMCRKRFTTAKQLREHSSVHENNKPFMRYKKSPTGCGEHVCKQCDRRFRKKCDLERHERVHSGEKPYTCPLCDGKFQQAHNLTKHMVTHTGVRSYTCDICQKTFGRSDVLTRHMHVHEVSKPFSCEFCYRTFVRQSQLTNHVMKRHPKKENTSKISPKEKNLKVNGSKIAKHSNVVNGSKIAKHSNVVNGSKIQNDSSNSSKISISSKNNSNVINGSIERKSAAQTAEKKFEKEIDLKNEFE